MATTNKIFIGEDDQVIELTGQAKEDFIADRELMQAEAAARQVEQDAKVAAKESAIAKLAALGLSEDEIKALVGE
jgi:hypothetical protein